MTICSVLLIVINCGVYLFSAFCVINELKKPKKLNTTIAESQGQTPTKKLSEEGLPRLTSGEELLITSRDNHLIISPRSERSEAEDSGVCTELNHEMKIGRTIRHHKKDSVDNFSIMQSSGLGLLSPFRTSSTIFRPPSISVTSREDMFIRGDFLHKTPRQKKIETKRINMKQNVLDDADIKYEDTERTETEGAKIEVALSTPRINTQGETELENLLNLLKSNNIISNSNE